MRPNSIDGRLRGKSIPSESFLQGGKGMYEVTSGTRRVNGVDVETWEREIIDANILLVEAGTNGYQGGDTGHGCRTYIRIFDEGGTDICAKAIKDKYGDTLGIEIALGGDSELSTIIEAFKFIVKVLEEGREPAL